MDIRMLRICTTVGFKYFLILPRSFAVDICLFTVFALVYFTSINYSPSRHVGFVCYSRLFPPLILPATNTTRYYSFEVLR